MQKALKIGKLSARAFKARGEGSIFLLVHVLPGSFIGAISQSDISNLRVVISGIGFVSVIADHTTQSGRNSYWQDWTLNKG